ncbi:ion channel [Polluticoccus soli]|uniref:ion channel n=1 Tax=Polluticoccus soli TaxID=3034150 RepID=UPI0023E2B6FA|nr:ion channel [Flavipsychrobacter sp. JY13-12]
MMQPKRSRFKSIENTGFSTSNNTEGGRLTNKDGSINLHKTGIPFWRRTSLYHLLLRMKRWKFFLSVFLFYTVMNILFASVYLIIGIENLKGIHDDKNLLNNFQQAFFFSSQTLTTVGYGHISPVSLGANIVASLESFIGILSFALVTGLLYGRFTRPKAYIMFSRNLLVAPHKGQRAIMVRLATYKDNHLTDVEAQVTLSMYTGVDDKKVRQFFGLPLEIKKINSLALSWTLVHLIDEESPLYGVSYEDMRDADLEFLYHIKGFDDHFSNTVQQRTSYVFSEIAYGAKFTPAFHRSGDSTTTILELDRLSEYKDVELPDVEKSAINP